MAELPAPTGVEKPKLGLALGSGSARGWAHIGVIQALEDMGVRPDVVAGTSIGALVGGAYVNGALSDFSEWVKRLTTRDVFSLMDFTFSGGVVKGEKLFGYFEKMHANPDIEELDQRFVAEATAAGMSGLKGHRSVGGLRASIYNAVPLASVQTLTEFMAEFARKNG